MVAGTVAYYDFKSIPPYQGPGIGERMLTTSGRYYVILH